MFRFLIGMETGTALKLPHAEVVRAQEVVINTPRSAVITVSGEMVETGVNRYRSTSTVSESCRFTVRSHHGLAMGVYGKWMEFRHNYQSTK